MVQMRSIFLVGFMGAGKTSVGAAVARKLELGFIDLDAEISKALGATVPEIFAERGEKAFRAAESEALARTARLEDVVVATGGGAFCTQANRDTIHRSGGISVFLDVPWEELEKRLAHDHGHRPMYGDAEAARRLFEARLPQYNLATIVVDGNEDPARVAEKVAEALREAQCVT